LVLILGEPEDMRDQSLLPNQRAGTCWLSGNSYRPDRESPD